MTTTITAKNKRGNVVFRSIEPRDMSDKDIALCLQEWVVDPLTEITITKHYNYGDKDSNGR